MDAVGADQHVDRDARAVVEPCLDAVAPVGEADEAMAEMDALGRKAGSDDRQQIGAVDRHVRRAVELFAQRVERRPLQGAAVLPAALVRASGRTPSRSSPGAEAEAVQDAHRIRPHVDAAADLGQLRGLLVDIDVEAGPAQRHRGGEPADAAADNGDLER